MGMGGTGRIGGTAFALAALLLAGCNMSASRPSNPPAASGRATTPVRWAPPPADRTAPVVVTLAPPIPSAALALDRTIARLGGGFAGDVGLAVRDTQTGWTSQYRGLDFFPQQSVSKLWVALTALDQADRGRLDLDAPITVGRDDLTLFHQPIRALALKPGGYATSAAELMVRALTQSDNTANDVLLGRVGGPDAVRATLTAKTLTGIRFGPGERAMQSRIAGLEWRPDYAAGAAFFAAREGVPGTVRRAAFDRYASDPVDGATPIAIVDALQRLVDGQLLSATSGGRMLATMGQTRTGANRLKGGLPPGWMLSHKTGTGQVLGPEQAGYNDVGVLTSPEGRVYTVAVLIGRTAVPLPTRMALMHRVVGAVADYDAALARQQGAGAGLAD